ncbi:MAG: hypothetical protein IJ462_01750 [Clostridia bacterium]|nr:hypothetical protein [Clostridia bacterium]
MKKIFCLIFAVLFIFSTVGCSDDGQSSVDSNVSSGVNTSSVPNADSSSASSDKSGEEQTYTLIRDGAPCDVTHLFKGYSALESTADSLPVEDVRKICELYVDMWKNSNKTVNYAKSRYSYIKGYGDAHYLYIKNIDLTISAIGEKTHSIDGYEFFNIPYNSDYIIYKNGQINSVDEAVKGGLITEDQKKDIMWLHLTDSKEPPSQLEQAPPTKEEEMRMLIEEDLKTYKPLKYEKKTLSDEMINKIKTDYIKACKKTGEWTVDDIRLETPTAYGDAYRMQIGYAAKGGFGPSITVMHGFTVFGYRLHIDYGAYHRTRIYKDGKFYPIKEACEQEILDRKYIVDIIVKNAVDQNFKNKYFGR